MNNWYVITGRTCSGKTTTVTLLAEKGYHVIHETATNLVNRELKKGKSIEEIRKNEAWFQKETLKLKIEAEKKLTPETVTFLDRGIPDSIGFYTALAVPIDAFLKNAVKQCSYKKVFFLEGLPYTNDYHRPENEKMARQVGNLILEAYESLPFPIVHVPVMEEHKRVDFILENL